jgi:hypothetical protein
VCLFLSHGASARPLAKLRTANIEHKTLPLDPPAELHALGVTTAQWSAWMALLEGERRAHLFHSCPECEPRGLTQRAHITPSAHAERLKMHTLSWTVCVWRRCEPLFFGFPLGPLQPCLCLLNPCTWWMTASVLSARARVEDAINKELSLLGLYFKWGGDETAQFRKGVPQRTLKQERAHSRVSLGRTIEIAGAVTGASRSAGAGFASPMGASSTLTAVPPGADDASLEPGRVKV